VNNKKVCTINSKKFDGNIYRSWKVDLIDESVDLLTFVGIFQKEINHSQLGLIRRGTISYEYYWKKKWYNIFRFQEPEGNLRNFYCNINQPPVFNNQILSYVDLDIDVIVWTDFSFQIVDYDEFEFNAAKFNYSSVLRKKVTESLAEVLRLIDTKSFPFDVNEVNKL
jgi:protein associated with RNAse G/E